MSEAGADAVLLIGPIITSCLVSRAVGCLWVVVTFSHQPSLKHIAQLSSGSSSISCNFSGMLLNGPMFDCLVGLWIDRLFIDFLKRGPIKHNYSLNSAVQYATVQYSTVQ